MGRARQRVLPTQEEDLRRKVQEVGYEVSQSWTAVYQSIARRMLIYLDRSEALEESTEKLKEQVSVSKWAKR